MAPDRLISLKSSVAPGQTMDRLEAAVKARGMAVFTRIDHSAGAAADGLLLRPTELLIFGHAKGGTTLMQTAQPSASTCR